MSTCAWVSISLFVDIESGELSALRFGTVLHQTSSLLLSGILLCRQYFSGNLRIHALATTLYNRVDWQWMLNGGDTLSMGWLPETGFIKYRCGRLCREMLTMLLMAIGASRNAVPPTAWNAVTRPIIEFGGIEFISGVAPLFIHQYAHAWCDFRHLRDAHTNYLCQFGRSHAGTSALRLVSLSDANFLGWTKTYGGSRPQSHRQDIGFGADRPSLAVSTEPSCPAQPLVPWCSCRPNARMYCCRFGRNMGEKAWTRYGFIDAFQPQSNWYAEDQLGIDLGISVLMAENLRTGFCWELFYAQQLKLQTPCRWSDSNLTRNLPKRSEMTGRRPECRLFENRAFLNRLGLANPPPDCR